VSTYCYVDTILHGATLEIKMGSPDAYGQSARLYPLRSLVYLDLDPKGGHSCACKAALRTLIAIAVLFLSGAAGAALNCSGFRQRPSRCASSAALNAALFWIGPPWRAFGVTTKREPGMQRCVVSARIVKNALDC